MSSPYMPFDGNLRRKIYGFKSQLLNKQGRYLLSNLMNFPKTEIMVEEIPRYLNDADDFNILIFQSNKNKSNPELLIIFFRFLEVIVYLIVLSLILKQKSGIFPIFVYRCK